MNLKKKLAFEEFKDSRIHSAEAEMCWIKVQKRTTNWICYLTKRFIKNNNCNSHSILHLCNNYCLNITNDGWYTSLSPDLDFIYLSHASDQSIGMKLLSINDLQKVKYY